MSDLAGSPVRVGDRPSRPVGGSPARGFRRLPDGELTLVFTDIEASTLLVQSVGARAYARLQDRHRDLLRSAFGAEGGQEVDTQGDAFFFVFRQPGAALSAAVAAQRALASEPWPEGSELRVRIGMNTDRPRRTAEGYVGVALSRGARICAASHGGQVLLAETTRAALGDALPAGIALRDLGEHRLKDLRYAEHLWQVLADGMPDRRTPPVTAGALRSRDRIVVLDRSAAREDGSRVDARATRVLRSPQDTRAALLAVIRGAERTEVFTPEQIQALLKVPARSLEDYWLSRVAEWSQPRYRLDERFVELALLLDRGEETARGRWEVQEERFESLRSLMAGTDALALVLLGPPGGGKSTMLRHAELEAAEAALRAHGADADARSRIPVFQSLSRYRPSDRGDGARAPRAWLAERWAAAGPGLPPLEALVAEGRALFLLDALNEMPAPSERAYRAQLRSWQRWLCWLVEEHPDNRVLFSCRTLDFSQPLSTPELRVPQVRIEPLGDEGVRDFLRFFSPGRWREIWGALEHSAHLDLLRIPYFLSLLVEQVEASGQMPAGRASLFTGFVRQALRREVERGSTLFEDGELLARRDLRQVTRWRWRGPYDLPERGLLVPALSRLAHDMQSTGALGENVQVRIDVEDALDLLDHEDGEAIVQAGTALAMLDEDEAAGELMYVHQLVQEYFAARVFARAPRPERVRRPWRTAEQDPPLRELLDRLPPAERLPRLPSSGWEETVVLAATMAEAPEAFVDAIAEAHLSLAGRAAAQPELRDRLAPAFRRDLARRLAARSRDPAADLRERIDCGHALGALGDPRFQERRGPDGLALEPPRAVVPGGTYPIGADEPLYFFDQDAVDRCHMPAHEVCLPSFEIARFPVTNAEWSRFMEAGGYEDERWWTSEAAREWRSGVGTEYAQRRHIRQIVGRGQRQADFVARGLASGRLSEEGAEHWRRLIAMSDAELDAHLEEAYPGGEIREPASWREADFNGPSQPVSGVCWFEASAFAAWLGAQLGRRVRLPTEAEWEAAARGMPARRFAYGEELDPLACCAAPARLFATTPVGAFVEGDTPEGVCDLTGNVFEWTSSGFGNQDEDPEGLHPSHAYPYRRDDGREVAPTCLADTRVIRGAAYGSDASLTPAFARCMSSPSLRERHLGVRLVFDVP